MKDDTVSRAAVIETIKSHFRVDNDLLEVIVYEVAHLPAVQTCEDVVSRADVLETYADLYDVFEDSKAICKELHKVYDRINALPAVQPQQIVRCKDCKWFGKIGCAVQIVDESDKPSENDFCSFAERRIDE